MAETEDTKTATHVNTSVTDMVTHANDDARMKLQGDSPAERLVHARKSRGQTQEQLADLVGTTKQQISRLESGGRALSPVWAEKLGRVLAVSPEQLLFGPKSLHVAQSRVESRTVEVVELDVRAAAGAGLENGDSPPEVARWAVPRVLMEGITTASPQRIRVITIYGDSMEPTFAPGTRIMVDTEDRQPSPPGVFVVFDGLGLVCKRVEFLPKSDPPSVRLTSDNPRYQSYECALGDAHIQGRVIGRWQWT
jgi:transcriptional regulator with XRE-family HTH domain